MIDPQFDIEFGKKLRDEGIQRAVDHADRIVSGWQEIAWEHFLIYLRKQPKGFEFLIEDFRAYLSSRLVEPPHNRAFGAIAVRGAKEGLINRIGYSPVKNSRAHRANASVWQKI